MKIKGVVVGPFQSNTWIVTDAAGATGVVVDPGDEPQRILDAIEGEGVTVAAILLTHGHIDHVGAAAEIAEATGAKVHLHPGDLEVLEMVPSQCRLFGVRVVQAPVINEALEDETELRFGALSVRCIHTPGHSPGHTCFLFTEGEERLLTSGDLLFAGSIGRTDLWGGNASDMRTSLERIQELAPQIAVYSGHGPTTTIGKETRNNPYLNGLLAF
ncbi:MAG: MBL fold metallo-hydrolase [Pseudomonadota bacterium]